MLEDNTSKFGTLVLVKQRTPLLPLYNKAVQVGRTVINFSVKAQHGNAGAANIEKMQNTVNIEGFGTEAQKGTPNKIPLKDRNEENQTMNNNGPGSSANLNEQMQANDSEELPSFQPSLLAQNTMPPEELGNNPGGQSTGMPTGFQANSAAANLEAAAGINPAYNEFQLQNLTEEDAIRMAMEASMQHGSGQNQVAEGQAVQSDMNS